MGKIYFISGSSGCGKSAIVSYLKKSLGTNVAVYDFDDVGVPENADKKWRQESTEKWLRKLLSESNDICLLGQIVLGEILACPSAKQIGKFHFLFLDVADFERIKRLKKRNAFECDQNILNWSSWLRMHHQDPQWMQQVLKDGCWNGLDFSCWDQLEEWDSKTVVSVLDTTFLTINQVAESVVDWINKIHEPELLPSAANKVIVDHEPSEADNNALGVKVFMAGKNIKNIIFDIGNVLLKFNPDARIEDFVFPITENIEMLENLYDNYQIYAITDAAVDQVSFEKKNFDFYAKFKSVLVASECNLNKNSPEIYQYFIKKHGLEAEETVFIEDNKENVDAAKKIGIHAIYFTSLDSCREELKSLGVVVK